MPDNIRATSDENLIAFAKNIATTYGKMGLLTKKLVTQAVVATNNIDAVNRVISKVGQLDPESKKVFGNYFVGENLENLDMATRAPAILAAAYEYISEHRNDSDEMRSRFEKIGAHVDVLSANFANTGGMVVNNDEWPLVDTNNIADAYEGLLHTFAARRADVERAGDDAKVAEFNNNLDLLQTVIAEYDHNWGLSNLYPDHADKLDDRWSDLWDALNRAELTPELKENLHKWGFTDAKGNEIPQFKKNGRLDRAGRLAAIIDLARHDVAKRHVARVKEGIDEDELSAELNEAIEFKLYNMAVADRIVNDATANPEQFNEPEFRAHLLNELSRDGAIISDAGYNAQIDADVNATAGWAARVKSKLRNGAENVGDFFGNIFRPINRVDRLANVRITGGTADKRTKRIEFFKRILKGFASAFIASAIITTIATAAAATAGISLAASMAAIGMVTAIGMGVVQIARWRRAQQKANKPTDIHAFLSDKRLVASLGVSAIAVVAMCFGAAGMATAATSLGYGALALGGAKNTVETFRDARRSNMSVAESLAWAIANAGAVIAGGFTGRMAANAGINYYNERNPENTLFQNATERTVEHTTEHTETILVDDEQSVADARELLETRWYKNNPDLLQARVDAINAYNVEHGTNIDPYRALLINADAGGNTPYAEWLHQQGGPNVFRSGNTKVFTDSWARGMGYTPDQIHAAASLFEPGSGVMTNPEGMDTIIDIRNNNIVSNRNFIEYDPTFNRPIQNDEVLPTSDIARGNEVGDSHGRVFSTFRHNTDTTIVPKEITTTETTYENVTDYNRANGDGMAMFGNYNRSQGNPKLRDRVGAVDKNPYKPLRPSDRRKPIEPIIEPKDDEPHGDIDVFPPVVVRKPDLPVQREKPELPVKPRGDIDVFPPVITEKPVQKPVIVPVLDDDEPEDKIFAITRAQGKAWKDLHHNMERVLNKMKKSGDNPRKMRELDVQRKDILHDIEQLRNDVGHETDEVIERAADEAIWRENLKQKLIELDNIMQKRPSDAKGKYAMTDWELNVAKVQNNIADLREKLGDAADESKLYYPMPVPGVQAQKKAARRAEYEAQRAEMLANPTPKPTPRVKQIPDEIVEDAEFKPDFDLPKYESPFMDGTDLDIANHRVPKLDLGRFNKSKYDINDDEIRVIGGDDEFVPDLSKPTNKAPVMQVIHEMPRHNERGGLIAALRNAYNKIKKRVPGREYFVPESLIKIAENANLTRDPVAKINGVPIHLVDLTGNNSPITQNENRAIVVVDIRGLRVPFYLSNGNEGGKAGHWVPLQSLYRNGRWMRFMFTDNQLSRIEAFSMISGALDDKIGDIRNYRDIELTAQYQADGKDGFVGGADAIEHVNPETVFRIINSAEYESTRNHMIFGTYSDNHVGAEVSWLRDYLDENGLPSDFIEENMNLLQRWRARRKSRH